MPLILGSQSPRRQEILSYFSLPFTTASPPFDESILPFNGDPAAYATELAQGKAQSLADQFPNDPILTADTIVYREGAVYGKPQSEEEAFEVLQTLAGSWHSVYTGIALRFKEEEWCTAEETKVLFNEANPEQLRSYHKALHCDDKAGGYAIQAAGGVIVNRIEGCYYNVMGLPINAVNSLLKKVNLSLWDYLA